jgi:hypothetical protein
LEVDVELLTKVKFCSSKFLLSEGQIIHKYLEAQQNSKDFRIDFGGLLMVGEVLRLCFAGNFSF